MKPLMPEIPDPGRVGYDQMVQRVVDALLAEFQGNDGDGLVPWSAHVVADVVVRALRVPEIADLAGSPFEDGWRLAEWNALPDECLIGPCDNTDIDRRSPVWLRDGSMRKACVEHWEAVHRVLGNQVLWEPEGGGDAYRWSPAKNGGTS